MSGTPSLVLVAHFPNEHTYATVTNPDGKGQSSLDLRAALGGHQQFTFGDMETTRKVVHRKIQLIQWYAVNLVF